jgi:plasmid maintenance system killer protein
MTAFAHAAFEEESYRCPGLLAGIEALPLVERLSGRGVLSEALRKRLDEIAVYATFDPESGTPPELLETYAQVRKAIEAVVRLAEASLQVEEALKPLYAEERARLGEALAEALVRLQTVVEKHRAFIETGREPEGLPPESSSRPTVHFSDDLLEAFWNRANGSETRGEAQRLAASAPWSRYAKIVYARVSALSECRSLLAARRLGGFRKYDAATSRYGWYSVRVDMQWRLLFRWPSGASAPTDLRVEDYHGE